VPAAIVAALNFLINWSEDMKKGKYHVFISFKNSNADGTPTRDSEIAREVYNFLYKNGLSVFMSQISLEETGIDQYKRAIDEALDHADTLVAIGTSCDHLNSQWVRYEWDSFYNDILSGLKPKGRVFVFIEGVEVSSLPRSLRQCQTFSNTPGAIVRLYNFIVAALGLKFNSFRLTEKSGTEHKFSQLSINYSGDFGPLREERGIKLKKGNSESLIEWSKIDNLVFIDSSRNSKGEYEHKVNLHLSDGTEVTMNVVRDWSMIKSETGLLFGKTELGETRIPFTEIKELEVLKDMRLEEKT
jgi:hypothetical protein